MQKPTTGKHWRDESIFMQMTWVNMSKKNNERNTNFRFNSLFIFSSIGLKTNCKVSMSKRSKQKHMYKNKNNKSKAYHYGNYNNSVSANTPTIMMWNKNTLCIYTMNTVNMWIPEKVPLHAMVKTNSFGSKNVNVPKNVCSRSAFCRRAILLGQTLAKEKSLISHEKTDSLPWEGQNYY